MGFESTEPTFYLDRIEIQKSIPLIPSCRRVHAVVLTPSIPKTALRGEVGQGLE